MDSKYEIHNWNSHHFPRIYEKIKIWSYSEYLRAFVNNLKTNSNTASNAELVSAYDN